MRKLLKIEVRKKASHYIISESDFIERRKYGVYIVEKGFLGKIHRFQTGPDYKTKKEALERANDWLDNRDFFENNRIFKYMTDKVEIK